MPYILYTNNPFFPRFCWQVKTQNVKHTTRIVNISIPMRPNKCMPIMQFAINELHKKVSWFFIAIRFRGCATCQMALKERRAVTWEIYYGKSSLCIAKSVYRLFLIWTLSTNFSLRDINAKICVHLYVYHVKNVNTFTVKVFNSFTTSRLLGGLYSPVICGRTPHPAALIYPNQKSMPCDMDVLVAH